MTILDDTYLTEHVTEAVGNPVYVSDDALELYAQYNITKTCDVPIFEQDRPAICLWQKRHWIIYCGMDDKNPDKVVIMDPARGRYSIRKSLFDAWYSGVFITNGIPERLPDGS